LVEVQKIQKSSWTSRDPETQQYLVEEVQKVYRDQGVSIHDKHID